MARITIALELVLRTHLEAYSDVSKEIGTYDSARPVCGWLQIEVAQVTPKVKGLQLEVAGVESWHRERDVIIIASESQTVR